MSRPSNVMLAVRESNQIKARAKFGHCIRTVLSELPGYSTQMSNVTTPDAAPTEKGQDASTLDAPVEPSSAGSVAASKPSSAIDATVFITALTKGEHHASPKALARRSQQHRARNARAIEFQPGTRVMYGSSVTLKSSQGHYLAIDPQSGLAGCVPEPRNATTFKLTSSDPDGNFGAVTFGDSIILTVQDHSYIDRQSGEVQSYVLGTKVGVDRTMTKRTHMQSTTATIPCWVPQPTFPHRKLPNAIWTVTQPTATYKRSAKGRPLRHLKQIALESGWERLASKGRPEDGPVSACLRAPPGTFRRQQTARLADTGKTGRRPAYGASGGGSEITAFANMRWTLTLTALGTTKEGGRQSKENKKDEQTLFEAQDQVYRSRRKRESRGDRFAFSLSTSMGKTYRRAENTFAEMSNSRKGNLYERLTRLYDLKERSGWVPHDELEPRVMDIGGVVVDAEPSTTDTRSSLGHGLEADAVDALGDSYVDDVHETTLKTATWPEQMTKLQRATALADAARLKALVKSSVWAEISKQQRLMEAEEEEELRRAVVVLQRATRSWIQKRWKVRLEHEDVGVFAVLSGDAENKSRLKNGRGPERRSAGTQISTISEQNMIAVSDRPATSIPEDAGTHQTKRTVLTGGTQGHEPLPKSKRPYSASPAMRVVPPRKAFGMSADGVSSQTHETPVSSTSVSPGKKKKARRKIQSATRREIPRVVQQRPQTATSADRSIRRSLPSADSPLRGKLRPRTANSNRQNTSLRTARPRTAHSPSLQERRHIARPKISVPDAQRHISGQSQQPQLRRAQSATLGERRDVSPPAKWGLQRKKARPRTAGQKHLVRLGILPPRHNTPPFSTMKAPPAAATSSLAGENDIEGIRRIPRKSASEKIIAELGKHAKNLRSMPVLNAPRQPFRY
jgi:hypothetical protein